MIGTQTKRREAKGKTLALGLLMAAFLAASLLLTATPAYAATTFTVNGTNDLNDLDFPGGTFDGSSDGKCDVNSGSAGDQCTLRAAIQQANKSSGADTIEFSMMTTNGIATIYPLSQLPTITQPVTIDGYSQDGATKNTLTQPGKTNAQLTIELSGVGAAPVGADGLVIDASNVVVRGLVINDFSTSYGIAIAGGTGHRIEGNFIGTDPAGTLYQDNGTGVIVEGADNSTIGGTSPDKRNLISGNVYNGVLISDSSGNKVQGNLIGTNKDGTNTPNNLGNGAGGSGTGVYINISSNNNTIGDSDPTDGATNAANTIAFNATYGVRLGCNFNTGNRILSNSIFSNLRLGINLCGGTEDANFVTTNDPKDPDTGPNRLQNYPLITSATTFPTGTSIQGTLNSTPSTRKQKKIFTIQFFSSPAADAPSGYGEGQTFLGERLVKTDRQGNASFGFAPFQKVPVGQYVTATATNKKTGDTSEFSQARVVEDPGVGG